MTPGFRSLPRAVISERALRRNAEAAVASGGLLADLRGDAFGHGVREVSRIVLAAGAQGVLVDESVMRELVELGVRAYSTGDADIPAEVLYGLPGSGSEPAMSLIGRVMSTKPLRAGEAVSYGYTHRAEHDTTVALVTGGYAQGIVRALGNRAGVEVSGALHPIVGRVAMDVCVVDIGEAQVEQGSDVIYFGGDGPARDELAVWSAVTGLGAPELVATAGLKGVREWTP